MHAAKATDTAHQHTGAPEGLAVLNTKLALARLGGHSKLYARVLASFIGDAGRLLQALAHPADTQTLAATLHTLKGLAGTVGAESLAHIVAQGEAAKGDVLFALLPSLQDAGRQAIAAAHEMAQRMASEVHQGQGETQPSFPSRADMDTLVNLLHERSMNATSFFEALNTRCASAMAEEFSRLAAAMERLDFDAALRCCEDIRLQLDKAK